jgi:hypothetical protein
VPLYLHAQLMVAPSKGQFFNVYIKDAHAFTRVG